MSDAQDLVAAADGFTNEEEENKIRSIVDKHIAGGSVDFLQKMYQRQASKAGLDKEDHGTLYDMLRYEDLNDTAQKFRQAMRNPKARGGEYVNENKKRKGITKNQLKRLVKEELKRIQNKKR